MYKQSIVSNIGMNGVITPYFKLDIGSNLFCMKAFIFRTNFIYVAAHIRHVTAVNRTIKL